MSTPANFNGARPVIDVNDSAMLLIDHQSGLFQTVGDMPMPETARPGRRVGEDGLPCGDPGHHHRLGTAGA
ncbi:Uncharacterised protein [Raoultella terrigena]|nr:Uncharacterised protein [Raoultella terrigena]